MFLFNYYINYELSRQFNNNKNLKMVKIISFLFFSFNNNKNLGYEALRGYYCGFHGDSQS
jgi:hypothetical protein